MEIKVVRSKEYIEDIVNIHILAFEGFFLTSLGKGFLRQLYTGYIEHLQSDIIIACDDEKIIGFIAYSCNISEFYKYLVKYKLINFARYSIIALLKKPKIIFKLLSAFNKSKDVMELENYVELSSIGVDPLSKNKGVGSSMIQYLIKKMNYETYSYIKLETDVHQNEAANYFYEKNGFKLDHSFVTFEGREMNEYRYEFNKRV